MVFKGHTPHGYGPLPIHQQISRMYMYVDRTYSELRRKGILPDGEVPEGPKWSPEGRPYEGGNPEAGHDDSQGQGEENEGSESEGQEGDGSESEDSQDFWESESDGQQKPDSQRKKDDPWKRAMKEVFGDSAPDPDGQAEAESPPLPPPKPSESDDWQWFVSEVKRLHAWCQDRAESGEWVDDFGMRPLIDGARAFKAGIPGKALVWAMTLHWSDDTKQEAGIQKFNPASMDRRRKPPTTPNGEPLHPLVRYVYRLAKARIPIMVIGPKGTGKSHLASDLAKLMDLPYGETPMTAGASPSWLIGGETMSGFKSRPFLDIYSGGGVFSFEEVDAADPNMVIVLNNAIANGSFYNPANGQVYHKHPDFIPFATANTFGLGANRDYTGRERLDGAFLDRFRMGRVLIDLDWNLGENVAASILDAA
jgi:hypothetical protein